MSFRASVRTASAGWLVLAAFGLAVPPVGTASVRYDVSARVDLPRKTITGAVRITFRNDRTVPLGELVLHLFPNRFRSDGDEIHDINRHYVYPRGEMSPGGVEIQRVEVIEPRGRVAVPQERKSGAGEAGATAALLEVLLDPPLAPGEQIRVRVDFETLVPERFGAFGVTEYGLSAVGGWYPYLAARDTGGAWDPSLGPEVAEIRGAVEVDPSFTVVLGEAVFSPGHGSPVETSLGPARNLDLVVLPEAEIITAAAAGTRVVLVSPAPRRSSRLGSDPPEQRVLGFVVTALEKAPVALPAPPALTVVEIPLRWNLTSPSDGAVVLSDRSLHVHPVLRGFHDAQIAQALYARLLRDRALDCETNENRAWVPGVVAWDLAARLVRETAPQHLDVHQWTSWLDVFAIVDRFEKAPKVPFFTAFFENSRTEDEIRESVFSYANRRAPARMLLERLERRFGETEVTAAVDAWTTATPGTCHDLAREIEHATGAPTDDVTAALAEALVRPPVVAPHTAVDPGLRPLTDRSRYQLVLDSAEVDVSSSEFGFAGLFVARKRYDYTKDFAIHPYYSERSYGVRAGPRLHFGEKNDATTYRHSLFGFFGASWLRRGFRNESQPEERAAGELLGFGLRYDYSNVYWLDDPSEQRRARLFADWYDHAFGSDYSFVRFGGLASATKPLIGYRTIGALQLLAGFEQPLSGRGVPLQEQFSLGGHLAIRGISVNARLARNIGLARFELRQNVYPEWDLALFDTLTFRRPQVRLFVDTGQVDDSAGKALNPAHWATGAGIGLGAFYEFLGFFPGLAFIEIATRLDRDQHQVQLLFGTRQAF